MSQSNDDEAAAIDGAAGNADRRDERQGKAGEGGNPTAADTTSAAARAAIAEAAYYRAQQRNFEPGHELEDWCAAEREIQERQGAGAIG